MAAPSMVALNDSQTRGLGQWSNGTSEPWRHHYNYYAALLSLLILVVVFGNVLVCMAVSRERALQTTTNYLIVSLAVADLLVATLVMPWVVYLEVVGEWQFSWIHCDIFVTLDVMLCTASILNLCAISIDRYTAVAMPMLYNTRYSSRRRVTLMITTVWVLSFAISCPLLFGMKNHPDKRDETICAIVNPSFVLYSSIVSFYVPFIVTLLVYVQIYAVLRRRRKRVAVKRINVALEQETLPPIKNKCTHPEDVKLCTLVVQSNRSTTVNKKKLMLVREAIVCSEESERVRFVGPPEMSRPTGTALSFQLGNTSSSCPIAGKQKASAPIEVSADREPDGQTRFFRRTAFEVQDEKQAPAVKSAAKGKLSHQKEKKATQMLAIVLGVFIICWLPFFITHILNVHCQRCYIPPALYSACTWLGYVNSAVNPIIYTTFNVEFRKAFLKILHC
ncbi:D(2)-like dopamine receptor [Scyliorhinus canicula]|uniref:D(2)-like dopamine receptor n=1 Tax=Scyliorhinus canicula TaxID=7830 RepID=UPI0018F3BC42|nr:D(2)-like dopamine receptor [Scyliorhinus canicula]